MSGIYSGAVQVTLPTQVVLQSASRLNVKLTAAGESAPEEASGGAAEETAEETVTEETTSEENTAEETTEG